MDQRFPRSAALIPSLPRMRLSMPSVLLRGYSMGCRVRGNDGPWPAQHVTTFSPSTLSDLLS
jgi:hypothetical protein